MTFLWPDALWGLLAVPVLIGAYAALVRRRGRDAARYAGLATTREGAGRGAGHPLPAVLFLLALIAMIVAIARPAAVVTLPSEQQTIILAMDVSGSMRARDVAPDRLTAAQTAARNFVKDQPRQVRIGLVSFAATASPVQVPTYNRDDLIAAIDRFQLQRGTSLGSAIVASLATLFPHAGIEVNDLMDGQEGGHGGTADDSRFEPVPPGSYTSAAIILVTDGQRTTGPDSLKAAKMAAERGVRVFTVGIGTAAGEVISFEGWSMHVRLDEETLKSIARITHGEYFHAGSEDDLKRVYRTMSSRLALQEKETEVTALFSAAAALLALLSAALSLLRNNRIL